MDTTMLMLIVACVLLVGGQIKIGDQTLLQLLISLIGGIFKPTPAPTANGQYGGILDTIKGLLSNPMVLIAIMIGVAIMTGGLGGCGAGGCKMPAAETPAPTPLSLTPTIWHGDPPSTEYRSPITVPYTGSHYADVQRLHLIQSGQIETVPAPWSLDVEPADLPPELPPQIPACPLAGCNRSPITYHRSPGTFWDRGPIRRFVASRPLRRLAPLRRVGRAIRWVFCGR